VARYLIAQQADFGQAVAISSLGPGAKSLLTRVAAMSHPFGEVLIAHRREDFSVRMQHLTSLDEKQMARALKEAQDKGWCRWVARKCKEKGCLGRGCDHEERVLLPTYPAGVQMPGFAATGEQPVYELGAWLLGWMEANGE